MPVGFLPQTYYGLVQGTTQTFRLQGTTASVPLPNTPSVGQVYALLSTTETESYIPAYVSFVSGSQTENVCNVILAGDYNLQPTTFNVVDMVSGEVLNSQIIQGLTFAQSPASYVGELGAQNYINHQVTALHDVLFNEDNVVYASLDLNADNIYNWVKIGNYRDGINGLSIRTVTGSTFQSVISSCLENDTLLAGEDFTADNYVFNIGDLYTITTLSPLVLTLSGNIRGAQGATGATGATGADGITPSIVNGYWHLGTTNTNVKAEGQDGQNGVDGVSFAIQTPLYSAPNNVGTPNNVDPQGNALATLPTLPQTNISGKGYVVYDPLTTPLTPFYDLYYANNNDTTWTIIHPFTGLAGKNGVDGLTPYIQNNYWYIGNQNTGVYARGPQGEQGPQGPQGEQGPQGPQGLDGAGSNPNLLINGDFRVNQRNFTSIEATSSSDIKNAYTVDRWAFTSTTTRFGKLEVNSNGGLDFTCYSQAISIKNVLEMNDTNKLKGKTLTATIKISNIVGNSPLMISIREKNTWRTFATNRYITIPGTYSITGQIPTDVTNELLVYISFEEKFVDQTTVSIDWVKLEEGEISTPFIQRPYAEELALCQRYYIKYNNNLYIRGLTVTTTQARGFIPLLQTLRTVPTVTIIDITSGNIVYEGNIIPISNYAYYITDPCQITVTFTASQNISSQRICSISTGGSVELDAEIY